LREYKFEYSHCLAPRCGIFLRRFVRVGNKQASQAEQAQLAGLQFWHLELACLSCLAKIVSLNGLLARLIDFCIEVLV